MRILWLKTELLHPVDKGGKIRTYNMLKELKRSHHVTYVALDDELKRGQSHELAAEYCHHLISVPHQTLPKFSAGFYRELATNLLSPLPYFMKKYESLGMRREIENQLKHEQFDVLVCDFLQPSVNVPEKLPIATVLFQHNVEAMIWKRHYEVQRNWVKKAYLYNQWRKTRSYEAAACQRFDLTVAVSPEDRERMGREYELEHVADVATGVDTEYFRPQSENQGHTEVEPHSLVFTGSMDWLPNEDAIQYFVRDIMPLVRQTIPDLILTVVGRQPYPSLIELSRRDPGVIVTGRVDDVRPYIERAAAYIVPMRVGGGTRLKIYEAMSMGKPVISTTIGAEGLPVRNGNELLLADTPKAFASQIVCVLGNKDLARQLGASAAKVIRERFGWAGVAEQFAQLCEEAVAMKAKKLEPKSRSHAESGDERADLKRT